MILETRTQKRSSWVRTLAETVILGFGNNFAEAQELTRYFLIQQKSCVVDQKHKPRIGSFRHCEEFSDEATYLKPRAWWIKNIDPRPW